MNQKGFSLIELIIVVAVISIIAAIAVPNLLQARRTANEASAVSAIGLIYRSQHTYKLSNTGEFADLPTLYSENYIDQSLGSAPHIKSGYRLELDVNPSDADTEASFNLRARPIIHFVANSVTATGALDFGINESGGIYKTDDNTPVSFDPVTREVTGTATIFKQ